MLALQPVTFSGSATGKPVAPVGHRVMRKKKNVVRGYKRASFISLPLIAYLLGSVKLHHKHACTPSTHLIMQHAEPGVLGVFFFLSPRPAPLILSPRQVIGGWFSTRTSQYKPDNVRLNKRKLKHKISKKLLREKEM